MTQSKRLLSLGFCIDCLLLFSYAGLIYWLSDRPIQITMPKITHLDKVLHFGAYGVFGFLMGRVAFRLTGSIFWSIWLASVMGTLYGVSDEWHQSFVPGRDSSAGDLIADACGAFAGGMAWWVLHRICSATPAQGDTHAQHQDPDRDSRMSSSTRR